jgi:hypothetical protein
MSQFAQSGSPLDDGQASDGDGGFIGVNQRLQLNQLEVGEVRESLNGRIDGHWKPRRGVIARTESLTSGGNPLKLPFFLIDDPKSITAASVDLGVVTITIIGHGLSGSALGRISGLEGNIEMDGDFVLTVDSVDTLTYPAAGLTSISNQSGTLSTTPIDDEANVNVRASCLFSDPNSSDSESVVLALDSKAVLVDLKDYTTQDISYPTDKALSKDSDMIQAFDRVYLFRDRLQAFEWFPNGRQIESASQNSSTTVTAQIKDHGFTVGDEIVVSGLTGGTAPNGTFTVDAIIDKDFFTYDFTTSQTQVFDVTNGVLKSGFTLVPGGVYTQPQVFKTQGSNGEVTNGVVSLDVTGNTTIKAGDTIVIYQTDVPAFSAIAGKSFEVLSATGSNISFLAPVADLASLGSGLKIEFGGRFSVGGGFIHQPAPPWGVYFQRRLWVPFYYTPSGTFNAPNYIDRNITDEIAISDILDSQTFDSISNQFRITGGTTDHLVAMQGFYDDSLVVLNRNSLHLISGTIGSLNDTKVTQLTTEVGCLARKSVVMKGNAMFFLSDDGIYAVEFLNDYNLRGADEPISKNIQPYIDRINKNLATEAVAVLFNNRYYLAVALDSVREANDARGNNSILIFNFLNKAWESVDTFDSSDFIIKDLIVGGAAERHSIYAVTSLGGLHELEATESSNDILVAPNGTESFMVESRLVTRGYSLRSLDRKRFTDGQITMQCVNGGLGEYSISFAAEDPDNNEVIGTTTDFIGGTVLGTGSAPEDETGNIRFRLGGIRGYVGSLTLTRTIGSPRITSLKVTASVTNRQIISQV